MLGLYLAIIAAVLFASLVWFQERALYAIWMTPLYIVLIGLAWAAGILLTILATITFLSYTPMRVEEI